MIQSRMNSSTVCGRRTHRPPHGPYSFSTPFSSAPSFCALLSLFHTFIPTSNHSQLVYLLKDSKASPLLAIFPPASDANVDPDPPLPCPSLFTLLALALHANLALHLHGGDIRLSFSPVLSYTHTYALAAVAPCLSLFLGRSWQATAWAAAPVALIALAHSVHGTLREGDEALAELEALKYSAPGA
ncbi:hypothetical protein C8R43DRAFT_204223 [Mycena crocata]|nr:hypothetical protein C8R43DRAFT_204223 [Mycena crocata]